MDALKREEVASRRDRPELAMERGRRLESFTGSMDALDEKGEIAIHLEFGRGRTLFALIPPNAHRDSSQTEKLGFGF
ncbi:hypothetical protein J5N97_028541 [Dioscorea zingiberensis]|uniref:Uncharacterized protein n=1 Tax=Dioscorea zingiberensis TaxID=325984 RepID=A0A9D5BZD7_9LILI|nr:hypothetical protein J5N97_028541 [Dioscorea zingiberensis]